MVKIKIPLVYNPIDGESLQNVLQRYDGLPHQKLVDDFELDLANYLGEDNSRHTALGLSKSQMATSLATGYLPFC